MDINEARDLAHEIMAEFGINIFGPQHGTAWLFKFDNGKRRFGHCSYTRKTISLSAPLTKINDRYHVEDTIRHEVAHVLAGPLAGHGREWKEACYITGADPSRCYSTEVNTPEAPWRCECPNGHFSVPRHRRKKNLHCAKCGRNVVFVPNTDIASN